MKLFTMTTLAVLSFSAFSQIQTLRGNRCTTPSNYGPQIPNYSCTTPANPTSYVNTPATVTTIDYRHYFTDARLTTYIEFVNIMRDYIHWDIYGQKFLPIKLAAANAQQVLQVYGPYHPTTSAAFGNMVRALNVAMPEILNYEQTEAFFQTIQDIKLVTLTLTRDLGLDH